MNQDNVRSAAQYIKRRRRRTKLHRVLIILGCLVVFCTTYALMLPAITEKHDFFCGMEEHTHTRECYNQISMQVPVLDCTEQSVGVHVHGDACYDSEGVLSCQLPDFVAHMHDAGCYDAEGELLCQLPEREGHVHGPECYAEIETEPPTQAEPEEDPAYRSANREQAVTVQTEAPTEAPTEETTEAPTEETTEAPTEETTEAPTEETTEAPTEETTEAPSEETTEAPTEETTEAPTEETTEAPTEETTEAPTEETTEAPSEEPETVLICTQPEVQYHVHGESCYHDAPQDLNCTLEENEEHTHSELCYGVWELVCGKAEHTHDHACASDPTADVETQDDWEKTFSAVELTGDWRSDVLSIARTQLGYEESQKNYIINEEGVQRGYTRYCAWYSDPYGDWCAMFTSFCMSYAQVEGVPLHAACTPWIEELKALKLFRTLDDYTPRPADLIFYDWEGDGLSDHVGFVSEIKETVEGTQIIALEGNSSNRVQYVTYDIDDSRIVGFGVMDSRRLGYTDCTLDEHVHIETCYNTSGDVVCNIEEHEHSLECGDYQLYYNDKVLRALVTIEQTLELPEDVTLRVDMMIPSEENSLDSLHEALREQLADSEQYVGDAAFYNLELYSAGEIYELEEDAKVNVELSFHAPVFEQETVERSSALYAYVIHEEQAPPKRDGEETLVYHAEPAEGETILEPNDGVTGLRLRAGEIGTVALALTNRTATGTFWERVDSADELEDDGTYMIVSVQGHNALRGNSSKNYQAVTLRSVKANEKYYTIDGSDDNLLRWTFEKSGSTWTIHNQGASNYYLNLSSNTVVNTSSVAATLTRVDVEKVWRFGYRRYSWGSYYYLRNSGNSNFTRATGEDTQPNYYKDYDYYYNASMLIFKLSDKTELTVPDDINNGLMGGSGSVETAPEKPDYADFITPSGGLKGETALVDPDNADIKVDGEYFSDPSTADIEKYFRADDYAAAEKNDGRVMTDKSVIYGDDNYDAFANYDPNTFSVTMSALGQDYKTPYEEHVEIPIDVVFIIDVSGSMTINADETIHGSDGDRIVSTVAATNSAFATIMNDNPENRVGLAIYSGGAWEVLPLDRYTATNDQFFVAKDTSRYHSATKQTINDRNFFIGGPTLKNDEGKSFANAGLEPPQGIGTFTQMGIAVGQKIFKDVPVADTTYTTTVGFGDYEREYSVQRQPVFILLSDGEPTYSTTNYMDPMSGPYYGDGSGAAANAEGIHGYYTVLTANYAKRMVGIHYQREPYFFTIGMGIKADSDVPNQGSNTGENYKRAVLNPARDIMQTLDTTAPGIDPTTTTDQLRQMLFDQYEGGNLDVTVTWPEEQLGAPHTIIPVLQGNPYYDDFSYANGAYFGEFPADELSKIFNDIIKGSVKAESYGFILYRNSSIRFEDNIGDGMQIKGLPVLRYSGVNYYTPPVTQTDGVTRYTYNATYTDPYIPNRTIDLSKITIELTVDSEGRQTISMVVPDELLPTYTPEQIEQKYYYESLPIRLIYQVGLTPESEEAVLALHEEGGELVFYTNRWDSDEVTASSDLYPSVANPYYNLIDPETGETRFYHEHHDVKSENTTGSRDNYVDCNCTTVDVSENEKIMRVHHSLGNNGKLMFGADTKEIPVEKAWRTVDPNTMPPVTLDLYKVTVESAGSNVGTLVTSIELSREDGWQGAFTDLPDPGEDAIYAIAERVVEGYQIFYSDLTVRFSVDGAAPITGVVVNMDAPEGYVIKVTNAPEIELPATGGVGVTPFLFGGSAMMLTAAVLLVRKRKKEHE